MNSAFDSRKDLAKLVLGGALLISGSFIMLPYGRLHEWGNVPWFLSGASVMLLGFLAALRTGHIEGRNAVWMFWMVAILPRVILLWQTPGDDIYRYVWEGRILFEGFNPYLHQPDSAVLVMMRNGIWEAMQHKGFTAIYPPLVQTVFAGIASIAPFPWVFKAVFLLADLSVAFLLMRAFGYRASLFYVWNPLVIYSFAGGGHYDSLFVLALVLAWLGWRRQDFLATAIWLGVAVAVKWLALPLLGWLVWRVWRHLGLSTALRYLVLGFLPFALAWMLICLWTGEWTLALMPSKFAQYARSAELIPAIIGWLEPSTRHTNQWILLPLALAWGLVILRAKTFAVAAQWIFFVALILTPMVHAWYFTWMLPFVVLTRNLGVILVTFTAFIYFMLYHHVETPGKDWILSPLELSILWIPFIAGFLWSEVNRLRAGESFA